MTIPEISYSASTNTAYIWPLECEFPEWGCDSSFKSLKMQIAGQKPLERLRRIFVQLWRAVTTRMMSTRPREGG